MQIVTYRFLEIIIKEEFGTIKKYLNTTEISNLSYVMCELFHNQDLFNELRKKHYFSGVDRQYNFDYRKSILEKNISAINFDEVTFFYMDSMLRSNDVFTIKTSCIENIFNRLELDKSLLSIVEESIEKNIDNAEGEIFKFETLFETRLYIDTVTYGIDQIHPIMIYITTKNEVKDYIDSQLSNLCWKTWLNYGPSVTEITKNTLSEKLKGRKIVNLTTAST